MIKLNRANKKLCIEQLNKVNIASGNCQELLTAIKVNIVSVSSDGLVPISHSLRSFSVFSDSGSQRGADRLTSVIIGRGVVGG